MKHIRQTMFLITALLTGMAGSLAGAAQPVYGLPAEPFQTVSDRPGLSRSMVEARELYRQAGLEDYFKDIAFLWSEPEKTRAALRPALVSVNVEPARRLGAVLLEVLRRYPAEPEALVMAGRYHQAMGQRDTARQHYHRALQVVPEYEPALIGLADSYLSENDPEQVLKILAALDSPEVWLRKGIAHLARGRYHLAVGYLIQAGISPGLLEEVRLKDLVKAYRAVGSLAQVKQWLTGPVPASRVGRVLVQDLIISLAIMEGRFGEAAEQLGSARATAPRFYYWNFYSAWLQLLTGFTADIGPMDAQLKSIIQVRQGQFYHKQGKPEEALRAFNDALKTDKQSLIGYLEAGTLEWRRQNYNAALKFFSKGLEINPSFIPLLAKRAEIYEHLNRLTEAAADRAAIRLAMDQLPPFTVSQTRSESGTVYLNPGNDVGQVLGIWFSEDGNNWSFTPWGRITLRRNATQVWLVPAGPGITGSAARVELAKPAALKGFPAVNADQLELNLPGKGQVVVEQIGNSTAGASFASEHMYELHRIPLASFGGNRQLLRVWYQVGAENWQTAVFQLNLPEQAGAEGSSETRPDSGRVMEAIPMLSISDFSYRSDDGGYQLQWRSEGGNEGRVRILTADGKWQEQAIIGDEQTGFTAMIPGQSRFCQVLLSDGAGHTVVYTDPGLNEQLMAQAPVQFRVNGGHPDTSSRQVILTPGRIGLRWSLSNDFRIWSQWFEGDAGSAWRIEAERGRQVIFIRYQYREETGEDPDIRYSAVFVDYQPGGRIY